MAVTKSLRVRLVTEYNFLKSLPFQVVGDKEVAVPTHLFKIILCQGKKLREGDESDPDAVCC